MNNLPTFLDCCDVVWRNTHLQYREHDRVIGWARVLWYLSIRHALKPSPVMADLLRVWHKPKMQHSDPSELSKICSVVMSGRELTYFELLQVEGLRLGAAA